MRENEIILSIGMIVKNEEKVLRRCLDSLQPLMRAISCELIIADTGSTDATWSIAEKYADDLYYFEWINDFAAARNSTIARAHGLWYMYVDADEYLDSDIHEITEFFSNPDIYTSYRSASMVMRNYTDKTFTEYIDYDRPFFYQLKDDVTGKSVQFSGSVHETIPVKNPHKIFRTVRHHTGYAFDSEFQSVNKRERNLILMREEYKVTDDKLRILSLLIDGCTYYPEEKEMYIQEALELLKSDRSNMFGNVLYMQAIEHYRDDDTEYALKLCEDYYTDNSDYNLNTGTVGILQLKAEISASTGNNREAVNTYYEYFKFYENYKKGLLDTRDCSAHVVYGLTDSEYIRNICAAVLCLVKLKRYDEAFELTDRINPDDVQDYVFNKYLECIRELCMKSRCYDKLAGYYSVFEASDDCNRKKYALKMMEDSFYSFYLEKDRRMFAEKAVQSGSAGKFIEIMKLYLKQGTDEFKENLKTYINNTDSWGTGCSELIYLALKYKIDISNSVLKMNTSNFSDILKQISENHDDFAEIVIDYGIPEDFMESMIQFYWIVLLYEYASYRAYELDETSKTVLYERFVSLISDYVMNIYNGELLNDDDIAVIPDIHKFGFYMTVANDSLSSGDNIGYIRNLKKALVSCESMKEMVKFMLEQFRNTMQKNTNFCI